MEKTRTQTTSPQTAFDEPLLENKPADARSAALLRAWFGRPPERWKEGERKKADDWAYEIMGAIPGVEWEEPAIDAMCSYLLLLPDPRHLAIFYRVGLPASEGWTAYSTQVEALGVDGAEYETAGFKTYLPDMEAAPEHRSRLRQWLATCFWNRARRMVGDDARERVTRARKAAYDGLLPFAPQINAEVLEFVDVITRELPKPLLEALAAHASHGSLAEAAAACGVTTANLLIRVHRARQRLLRRVLDEFPVVLKSSEHEILVALLEHGTVEGASRAVNKTEEEGRAELKRAKVRLVAHLLND
jgi:hypothetical protein